MGKPEVITNWLFSKQRAHELTIVFLWFKFTYTPHSQWRIQGRGPGGQGLPLFRDQTKARKAEKYFFETTPPVHVWYNGNDRGFVNNKGHQKSRETTSEIWRSKGELTACVKSLQLLTRGCVIEVCLGLLQKSNFSWDEPNPNFGRPKFSSPVVSDVCRS